MFVLCCFFWGGRALVGLLFKGNKKETTGLGDGSPQRQPHGSLVFGRRGFKVNQQIAALLFPWPRIRDKSRFFKRQAGTSPSPFSEPGRRVEVNSGEFGWRAPWVWLALLAVAIPHRLGLFCTKQSLGGAGACLLLGVMVANFDHVFRCGLGLGRMDIGKCWDCGELEVQDDACHA